MSVERAVLGQHAGIRRYLAAASLAATVLPLGSLPGQVIRGKVVESRSDSPITGAQVTLLDSKKRELDVQSRTDSAGEFILRVPAPGRFIVRARRIGYNEYFSVPKDVRAADTIHVNLWPEANEQLLDSLLILAGRPPGPRSAFAARQRGGHGQFLDRRTILKEEYHDLEEALTAGFPGLAISRRQLQVTGMCFRSCCTFSIYRNGTQSAQNGSLSQAARQLEGALPVRGANLYGIELFIGRNEIPMEYRDGSRGFCGVLSFWTRAPD